MKRYLFYLFVFTSLLFVEKELYSEENTSLYDDPTIIISRINQVGVQKVIQDILNPDNKASLDKVLAGIRSGNDLWLTVLSKIRPPLRAFVEAIQFDVATGEALDKNPIGVLKNAAIISREWYRLVNIDKRNLHYLGNICDNYPDMWNEEKSIEQHISVATPILKKRKETIMRLNSPDIPDEIKNACLERIDYRLKSHEKTLNQRNQ